MHLVCYNRPAKDQAGYSLEARAGFFSSLSLSLSKCIHCRSKTFKSSGKKDPSEIERSHSIIVENSRIGFIESIHEK